AVTGPCVDGREAATLPSIQSLTSLSLLPETTSRPSAEMATALTSRVWADRGLESSAAAVAAARVTRRESQLRVMGDIRNGGRRLRGQGIGMRILAESGECLGSRTNSMPRVRKSYQK